VSREAIMAEPVAVLDHRVSETSDNRLELIEAFQPGQSFLIETPDHRRALWGLARPGRWWVNSPRPRVRQALGTRSGGEIVDSSF
jgi:hypothetical protein